MRKTQDIRDMKVCKKRCKSCPFNEDGDKEIRHMVEGRLMQVSQTCHSTRDDKGDDHLICRGARDKQLELMHRLGVIESATDEAWEKARKERGI